MARREVIGHCEIGAGVDSSGLAPRVILCGKEAKLRKVPGFFDVFICDDCQAKREKG